MKTETWWHDRTKAYVSSLDCAAGSWADTIQGKQHHNFYCGADESLANGARVEEQMDKIFVLTESWLGGETVIIAASEKYGSLYDLQVKRTKRMRAIGTAANFYQARYNELMDEAKAKLLAEAQARKSKISWNPFARSGKDNLLAWIDRQGANIRELSDQKARAATTEAHPLIAELDEREQRIMRGRSSCPDYLISVLGVV